MRICVVGTGYVGLVAAAGLARAGFDVVGVDKDQAKIDSLSRGISPIYEPGLDDLLKADLEAGKLHFTSELKEGLKGASMAMVAVGTPSLPDGRVDLSAVYQVTQQISQLASNPLTVVMKSTVPPGTGVALYDRYLSKSHVPLKYASNPEFLREGRALNDWYFPDRVVVGSEDEKVAEQVLALYEDIKAPKVKMGVTSAEMVKYAANAFLATKISFINEIANLCELVGADIVEVAEAVGMDKRIGKDFLKAGIGYGGSCFPKDTKGLDYISSFNGYTFSLLKAVIEVNARQRLNAVRKLNRALHGLASKRIAVLGLAFKPQTDDVREAPALDIINHLINEGASVKACDPVAGKNAAKNLSSEVVLCEDPYEAIAGAQAILLATEWEDFVQLDWARIKRDMTPPYIVLDGRNALDRNTLETLGFGYMGIGRGEAEPKGDSTKFRKQAVGGE